MTRREVLSQAFQWWLAAGCKTYGKTPGELAAMVRSYAELLDDVDEGVLREACKACAQTCSDFPAVADIRKAVEERREALRAAPEPPPPDDCEFCGGSGWEEVTVADGTAVKRCRCKAPGYVLPPAKPRALLTAAEKAEFEEVLGG
jgi:hypothetical protein